MFVKKCVLLGFFINLTLSSTTSPDFGENMSKFFKKLKIAVHCEFDGQQIEPFVFNKTKIGHRPLEFDTKDFL